MLTNREAPSRPESFLQEVPGAKGKLGQRESCHLWKRYERKLSYSSSKGQIVRIDFFRVS